MRNCVLSKLETNTTVLETFPINGKNLQKYDLTHGTSISGYGINCEGKTNCQAELLEHSKKQSANVNSTTLFTSEYWIDKAVDVFSKHSFLLWDVTSAKQER